MEVRQIEHFLAVANAANFTRAARSIHLSQSALSASIRALERELQTQLFERTTRKVALTTAGQTFRAAAYRILGQIATAREELTDLHDLSAGTLAVGTVQTLTVVDLPAVLAQFNQRYSHIRIALHEATTAELVRSVQAAELDVAYVALDASPLPRDLTLLRGYEEDLAVVTAHDHPLATRAETTLAELADYTFVEFSAGTGLQTVIETLCAEAGLHRRIGFRATQMGQVLALVGHGLGISIVPSSIAEGSGLATVPIGPASPSRKLALVSRSARPSNPAARAFLELLAPRISS
ncbi:DNA-binding transcriptional LysR family regulator [Antricoccus suffuscus]|uniref:DNA-binding transcriptional LysR family regulator n=1 Tax=Antricoccus suffuscus TaxID=1629062 RepID=A0A2T1A3D4_9ACTN|nr:LysR family transcriptional regulator [Antricoccus suffuscus]PRZ43121.1 DNA-binding transcriptional LysR family regulator [Antricoccus suffuscus]